MKESECKKGSDREKCESSHFVIVRRMGRPGK
jgi:hypothetical protein